MGICTSGSAFDLGGGGGLDSSSGDDSLDFSLIFFDFGFYRGIDFSRGMVDGVGEEWPDLEFCSTAFLKVQPVMLVLLVLYRWNSFKLSQGQLFNCVSQGSTRDVGFIPVELL